MNSFTILGAKGFVGSNLVSMLNRNNISYYAPKRDESLINRKNANIIYCIGLTADFREKPFETIEAHVCKLKQILFDCDFDSFTYLSSTRVYSHNIDKVDENSLVSISINDPFDLFNSSKLTGELLALNCGKKKIKIARLSNIYGYDFESKNFITSIVTDALTKGKIILRTTPDSAKDYIGIDDVVSLLYRISSEGKESIYNVASGFNTRNDEILDIIQHETGCEIEYNQAAERNIFPEIQVNRIKNEFGFSSSSNLLQNIPKIIEKFKKITLK